MTGTVDAYREQVRPGEYRTPTSRPWDRQLLPAGQIHSSLAELIATYEKPSDIKRNHILDFHVCFEAQVELEKLRTAGQLYLSADYKEDCTYI